MRQDDDEMQAWKTKKDLFLLKIPKPLGTQCLHQNILLKDKKFRTVTWLLQLAVQQTEQTGKRGFSHGGEKET